MAITSEDVGSLCELIKDPFRKALCLIGAGQFGSDPRGAGYTSTSCPTGYKLVGRDCVKAGVEGMVERGLPGGETGTLAGVPGMTPVAGRFGPGYLPRQVGSITRDDGTVGPLLRCLAGMVLGKDSVCYERSCLARRERKHPPGRKPLLTGGDMAALSRAKALKGKIKTGARTAGLFVADHRPHHDHVKGKK